MQIINAIQAKNGVKTEQNKLGTVTQPLQFLFLKRKRLRMGSMEFRLD
jgi:hypothetical protein